VETGQFCVTVIFTIVFPEDVMNDKNRIYTAILFLVVSVGAFLSCEGTSTDDYLNGDFISSLGEDTTAPNILTPRNGEKILTINPTNLDPMPVTLQWTAKNTATHYTVEIATDPDFTDQIAGSPMTVADVSIEFTPPDARRYYWRVRADTTAAGSYGSASFDAMDATVYVYCPDTDSTCSDSGMVGNKDNPYRTITAGLVEAQRIGLKKVKVASRNSSVDTPYVETIPILNGVDIFGGYPPPGSASPDTAFSDAARDSTANRTIITGDSVYGVFANNIFQKTTMDGFVINGPDEDLGTFGLYVVNSSKNLTIKNCVITGGGSDSFYTVGATFVDSFSLLEESAITGGVGRMSMGMIFQGYGSPEIKNSTIAGADLGSSGAPCDDCESTGILMDWGFPVITYCTIEGGKVVGDNARSIGVNVSKEARPDISHCAITTGDVEGEEGETVGIKVNGGDEKASVIARNNDIRPGNVTADSTGGDIKSYGIKFEEGAEGVIENNIIIAGDVTESSSNLIDVFSYGISLYDSSRVDIKNNVISSGSIIGTSSTGTLAVYGVRLVVLSNSDNYSIENNTIMARSAGTGNSYVIYASGPSGEDASPTVNYNILFSDVLTDSYGYYEAVSNDSDPKEFSNNLVFDLDHYYSYFNEINFGDIDNVISLNDSDYTTSDSGTSCHSNKDTSGGTSGVFISSYDTTDPTTWIILGSGPADLDSSGGWSEGDIGADTANVGPQ
jgi:hypothetical protein